MQIGEYLTNQKLQTALGTEKNTDIIKEITAAIIQKQLLLFKQK